MPRVDVTWRISGLFRDLFPAQIALMDAAVRAVATREESDEDNPLAAAARLAGSKDIAALARIFGTAPGAYGAGIDDMLGREHDRGMLAAAYLGAASHVYGGAEGGSKAAPGEFAARITEADLLVHPGDDPTRDLLEGSEDAAFVGGFAAAAAMLGRAPDLIMLDMTDPQHPRARPLEAALARIVRGRAINPRFIAGLMRHGARGAAELAETVDRLVAFAETTGAVPSTLLDLVHAAYLGVADVREFSAAREPSRRAHHRRAARSGAAQWALASCPQRYRSRPPGLRSGGAVMNAPHRRGACPGLSAPMATGDGLLVRLLPIDRIALDAFIALCTAAREHGNGTIEVTARGSLQVRGLSARSAPAFARCVAALDIAATDGVSVISDPLPDDPDVLVDTIAIAAMLRRSIADAGLALAPKICVLVDGGGRLHLDALAADLRLRTIGSRVAPRFHVSLGGDAITATPLGSVPARKIADIVVRLLGVIAAHGVYARAADVLRGRGAQSFCAAVGEDIERAPALPPRPHAEVIGRHALRDASIALGIALAFGHAHADALVRLAHCASAHGARFVRLAPGRALLLPSLTHETAAALAAQAQRYGFLVRADDPRRRIIACPGKPACASGLIAARELASELSRHLPPSPGTVHISGCVKGCAHPGPAALTVVGTDSGCGIIEHGSARAVPHRFVDCADVVSDVARLAGKSREALHA